ncbi:hypothetical protein EIP91_000109 [Steccherinum ochraceum]|uniref:Protein kinase domain-containing protein n=1 Tax=Steccherinum ochraceum TaxID=92696 RepID=A0A4V6N7B9_9APHY|nr:hypothetical protein EIP91_000109 [Steccherinum ochraceum]
MTLGEFWTGWPTRLALSILPSVFILTTLRAITIPCKSLVSIPERHPPCDPEDLYNINLPMKKTKAGRRAAATAAAAPAPPGGTDKGPGLIDIEKAVNVAIFEEKEAAVLALSRADAQAALDYVWMLMGFPATPGVPAQFQTHDARNSLRRLSLKLAVQHDMFPAATIIKGVIRTEEESRGFGGFAEVFIGTVNYMHVALKRLRSYVLMSDEQKLKTRQSFYRETMLWKHLNHPHVLAFLGVSAETFKNTICMVLPWMPNGSLRSYIPELKKQGKLVGQDFIDAIDRWLHQMALGLAYLHQEGIVHGDLHAGNILVDGEGNALLTDFGMALIAEATASQYGSAHGGGATRYLSPELIDPEEFDLEVARPTKKSDVYSYACTAIELYTSQVPFPDILQERIVMRRVVKGQRPPRPRFDDGGTMSDALWSLIQRCWAQQASDRPEADEVASTIGAILAPATVSESFAAQSQLIPYRVESHIPPDAEFDEFMNQTPTTPEEREAFLPKAVAEGGRQLKSDPPNYMKAARAFHRALAFYSSPQELMMIYEKSLPPNVFSIIKDLNQG